MRPLSQVYIYILITLTAALSQKDNDEGRPYEFGFTIDGQQHRHEKKDQKGIVQGEFGFITADGVYHVTVYATDENGNFKILSMRNIRISAPLDGSPALGPISPDAGKYLSKQNQLEYPKATPAEQSPQIQVTQSTQLLQTVTQRPGSYAFTTLPTIKPACGGCGYVTTQKPLSKETFPFQNPAFKGTPNTNSNSGSTQVTVGGGTLPQLNQGIFTSSSSTPQIDQQSTGYKNEPAVISNLPPIGPQQLADAKTYDSYPQNPAGGSNGHINPPGDQLLPPGINNQNQERFFDRPTQFNLENPQGPLNSINEGTRPGEPVNINGGNDGTRIEPNVFIQPRQEISQLPPIEVSDNKIHVSGSKPVDIPIKDKYPGMVDGLPNGIEEKDIKDILYKFHYTVGFHGHYEKGLKNGAKIGGYFVNGRDGISRIVTYVADENGYRPKFKFINLGLDSSDTPKEGSEKQFGLKSFEFVWYPIE